MSVSLNLLHPRFIERYWIVSDNKPDPLVDEFVIPAIKHLHRLVFWALEPALKPVSFVKVKSVEHLSGVICEIMMK